MFVFAGIEPLDESESFLRDDHYMKQVLDMSGEFGRAEEDGLAEVLIAWGIKGVNRDGSDYWDLEDYGKIKWDNSFDMSSYDAQLFMYQLCVNLSESDIVFSKSSVICPLNSLVDYIHSISCSDDDIWLNETDACVNISFPWTYIDPTDSDYDPTVQKYLFAQFVYNFSIGENAGNEWELVWIETPQETGYDYYNIKYFAIDSKVDLTSTSSRTDRIARRKSWNKWVSNTFTKNDNCPDNVCDPIQVSFAWTFIESQDALVLSAMQGIGIALPISFLVMIFSTKNWIVATFATLDILGVMGCGLSVMAIAGWQFGTAESISIVIIIGFSVDYVVHLANAYLECTGDSREERLRFSLLTMGVSVVSGAVTSALAGIFLLFTSFLLFFKMGTIMLVTIISSLIWAMLFFSSMLAVCGPQGETGNVPFDKMFLKCKSLCKKDEKKK